MSQPSPHDLGLDPANESPYKGKTGLRRVWNAFGYSLAGLKAAYLCEDAFRQEAWLAVLLIPAALLLPVPWIGRGLMIASLLIVLVVELLNSAIEAVVDRVSLENHRLAKRAKDIGSAAVLVSLLMVAVVWACVLLQGGVMSLKITFVTETFPPEVNGVAMTVGRLVSGMRERGHRVSVIRPRQGKLDIGSEHEMAMPGLPLPGYPGLRFGLPAGGHLARRWRQQRPDLVHVVTEGPLGWSAVSVARRLGIPVTSGFHTNFDRYSVHYGFGWMRPALAAYLRTLHRRTRATMVPTAALAADLAGEGILGVRVVGRGVDTRLFDPNRHSLALRQAWGVAPGALACLYVGRLAAEKNLALVEKSFATIRQVLPTAKMIWVGDGPSAARLRAAHPDHCFAGTRLGEDLAAHYASADLFLFPSLSETYGNVVAEAMASGLPVLAYRSAAAAELISDGANGQLVPPGDEAAYLNSVLALVSNLERLPELAAAARYTMLPRNWANVVERFETVAREAMG